jgi:hypothetical protein
VPSDSLGPTVLTALLNELGADGGEIHQINPHVW